MMRTTRRFLAVLLSTVMMFTLLPGMPVSAVEGGSGNPAAQEVVLPDLSNLEQLEAPARKVQPAAAGMRTATRPLQELDYDALPARPVNGKDFPPIPEDAVSMYNVPTLFSLPTPSTADVGTEQVFYDHDEYDGTTLQAIVAAQGEHCRVYVDQAVSTYNEFAPDGTTATATAQAIADEFDDMYDLLTGEFDMPDLMCFKNVDPSGTINILLYDIDGDGAVQGGTFTAGYFYSGDFYQNNSRPGLFSNEDAILYVDVDENHGYKNFTSLPYGKYSLYGTVAHEFQHLINFSKLLKKDNADPKEWNVYQNDPDISNLGFSLWLNEGMSGLAEALYLGSHSLVNRGHLNYFLQNNFYQTNKIGYVPHTLEWQEVGSDALILANYGSSNYLMQEYYSYGRPLNALLDYETIGYYGSLENVGANFRGEAASISFDPTNFNQFFMLSMLNLAVDTPNSTVNPIYNAGYMPYYTLVFDNAWSYRTEKNYTVSSLSQNQTVALQDRRYFSQLYLADAVGASNNAVTITTPAIGTGNATYFVITPFDATGVNDRTKWNNTAKIAGTLAPGTNTVRVGTDNMFAILALSLFDPVDTETISYAVANSPKTDVSAAIAPAITVGTYTYDGTAQGPDAPTSAGLYIGSFNVVYTGKGTTTYSESATKPTNAGDYTVTVSVPTSNQNYTGTGSADFTISKAAYTGQTTASAVVRSNQVTTNASLILPTLPDGASYPSGNNVGTVGGNVAALISDHSVSGNTLTYSTTGQTSGVSATITFPVSNATNYNSFNVVATITATDKENVTISVISVTGDGKTYDGNAVSSNISGLSITLNVPGDKTSELQNQLVYAYTSTDT